MIDPDDLTNPENDVEEVFQDFKRWHKRRHIYGSDYVFSYDIWDWLFDYGVSRKLTELTKLVSYLGRFWTMLGFLKKLDTHWEYTGDSDEARTGRTD